MHGISLPGYVIGLAVSRRFIPIVIDAVPFEAGALSTSAVQATQANLYFPNRSTLLSNKT